jgi:hypothetical protein
MPAKKGLKSERQSTPTALKPVTAAKRQEAPKIEKKAERQPSAKVHPFSKFIKGNRGQSSYKSANFYREPPLKKAV